MKKETFENKGVLPDEPEEKQIVRIRIKQGRAVEGVGGPGDVVSIFADAAERLVSMGYADIVNEE